MNYICLLGTTKLVSEEIIAKNEVWKSHTEETRHIPEAGNADLEWADAIENPHGGQEQIILQLYTTMYHWGAIVAAPGYTDPVIFAAGGNPYGVSATVKSDGMADAARIREAVYCQTERTLRIAQKLHINSPLFSMKK